MVTDPAPRSLTVNTPVGAVPIPAGEFLVLRAVKPRDDRGEQAGQVLDAFDDVSETLVGFGELVHDPGHRGAVPRGVKLVVDPADQGGGAQWRFPSGRSPTAARPEANPPALQTAGGSDDG